MNIGNLAYMGERLIEGDEKLNQYNLLRVNPGRLAADLHKLSKTDENVALLFKREALLALFCLHHYKTVDNGWTFKPFKAGFNLPLYMDMKGIRKLQSSLNISFSLSENSDNEKYKVLEDSVQSGKWDNDLPLLSFRAAKHIMTKAYPKKSWRNNPDGDAVDYIMELTGKLDRDGFTLPAYHAQGRRIVNLFLRKQAEQKFAA